MARTDGSHTPKFAKCKRSRMLLQGLFTILGIKRRLSFPSPFDVIKKSLGDEEKHSFPLSPKLSPDAGKCLYLCKVFRAEILARRRCRADIVQTAVNDRSDAQPADPPSARLPEERRHEPSSLAKKGKPQPPGRQDLFDSRNLRPAKKNFGKLGTGISQAGIPRPLRKRNGEDCKRRGLRSLSRRRTKGKISA